MSGLKLLKNCDVLTPLRVIRNGSVLIQGERIRRVGQFGDSGIPPGTRIFNFRNKLAVPGFIDIHLHGAGGVEFTGSSPESIVTALKTHLRNGTTSLLPSLMTAPHEQVLNTIKTFLDIKKNTPDIPEIIGINLEGPYISKEKRGVQRTQYIRRPSLQEMKEYIRVSKGSIKIVTIAPEIEGISAFIRFLTEQGIIPSAGHTNADFEQTQQAIESGVILATHLFNAMRGIAHREPGAAGALLLNDEVYAEVVADGIHLHPSILSLIAKAKPLEKIILVTDATKFYGIRKGASYSKEGKLFGSNTELGSALKHTIQFTGIPFERILRTVTVNPAKLLNIENKKGLLKKGNDADIVILDKELNIKDVFIKGKRFSPSENIPSSA
jgi:N-acetylglucosamine-6-phosphate deacetylase